MVIRNQVAVLCSSNVDGRISKVTIRRARLVIGDHYRVNSLYDAVSHSGQLSLLLSAGRKLSTGHKAVEVLCDWEGNGRMGQAENIAFADIVEWLRYKNKFTLHRKEFGRYQKTGCVAKPSVSPPSILLF